MKNLTLDIQERVKTLEEASEDKKIGIVKKDLTTLESKIDSVEDKLVDDVKTAVENMENKISQSNKANERDRRTLNDLLLDNERKLNEVEKNLHSKKNKVKTQEKSFKCEECGETYGKKNDLRSHIKKNHPKYIKCESCGKICKESWQYETHLETHSKTKENKCDVCGKEFFLGWRLGQHMKIHKNRHVKNCHYFNNQKVCPYDAIGCKFNHVDSVQINWSVKSSFVV